MVVFDAGSGSVLRTFALPVGVHNFLFDHDGSALFAFTVRAEVYRIDPDTGRTSARIEAGSIRGLAWTAGSRHLIAAGKGELLFLDRKTLSEKSRIRGLPVGQIFYPAATPDGRWILAPAVLDGVILVIDTATGAVSQRIETGSPLLLTIDPDSNKAWVSNVLVPAGMFGPATKARDGGVSLLDLETFEVTAIPGLTDTNGLAVQSHS